MVFRPLLRGHLAFGFMVALGLGSVGVACPAPAPTSSSVPPPVPSPTPSEPASGAASTAPRAPTVDISPFVPERVWSEGAAMGTHVGVAAYTTRTTNAAGVRRAFELALAEIKRVEGLMTTWRESEITRVNGSAGGPPVAVSAETFDLVKEAVHASEISAGAFDITFESLHGLWKFDEDLDPHPPTDAQIKAKLPLLDYRHIRLDPKALTIGLARPGVKIGLGGIAKGYAVDRAVKVLEQAGLVSFFVQAGGDLFARGKKPDGTEWSAGVRDPRGKEPFALIPLTDHAFSTAGDYERSYVVNGRRFHHIIDPKTGYPAKACRSVTIWAPTALLADEIDDAVFIMGPEKGLALVESLDGVGALVVDAHNHMWISKRLEGKVRVTAPPSEGL